VFGSLVHGLWISNTSDVDLATWDIYDKMCSTVVAKLYDISYQFKVDLVMLEYCKPCLKQIITEEGKVL